MTDESDILSAFREQYGIDFGNWKVEITEQDCIEGCRGTTRYCVISTAIARLLPEANRPETSIDGGIRFTLPLADGRKFRFVYPPPDAARKYVIDFDKGIEPKPMKPVLNNPQIAERPPTPKGKARTSTFKPQAAAKTHRTVRVFGERAFQAVSA